MIIRDFVMAGMCQAMIIMMVIGDDDDDGMMMMMITLKG